MPDKHYKQIVILSGKGGTGKTTVATALSEIAEAKVVIDTDVDAANMHLVFDYYINSEYDYYGGKKAEINSDKCTQCGICESVCRFDAIKEFKVSRTSCEGCGFCFRVCPDDAISFYESKSGVYSECELEDQSKFYYAQLLAGEGNSGKLVSEIKKKAYEQVKENVKWIIIDGPPGIGCPVNASLSGVDFVVIVTEPTQSGLHDLKRLINLLKIFKIPSGVIINKYDINTDMSNSIEKFIRPEGISLLAKIPFDKKFIKAIQNSKSIIEYDHAYIDTFKTIWNDIQKVILN
ncbi:MAG: (4Fe-4S)-binding protein [Ignavibacteriales bacterium]|nr:MAG: (4Fe-4S)-binding protein [Ignavibacteriales bacterium]